MTSISPQIIRTENGEELLVLTRAEFEELRAGQPEAAEDVADAALFAERMAGLEAGRDEHLPPEVSAFMLRGDSLLRALRKWKGMTQLHVADCAGPIAQGYLSDLETGRKKGTPQTLRSIAGVLGIDPDWLIKISLTERQGA